jgi:chromosomal replication initiator protein
MKGRFAFIPHSGLAQQPSTAVPVLLPSKAGRLMPIGRIQTIVALSYDLNPALMPSAVRWRKAAWPRQVAMYLTRELTDHSLPSIGRYFGNRDHTTVLYAIRAVEKRMASDPVYRGDVEALKGALAA